MRTPLDAFHQALVNLVETRRRTEQEGTVRRRRRVGVSNSVQTGTLVRVHVPVNLRQHTNLHRFHNMIGKVNGSVLLPSAMSGTASVEFSGEWDLVSLPMVFLELVDPPPTGNNIEEIEAWLAS